MRCVIPVAALRNSLNRYGRSPSRQITNTGPFVADAIQHVTDKGGLLLGVVRPTGSCERVRRASGSVRDTYALSNCLLVPVQDTGEPLTSIRCIPTRCKDARGV